jgi:hypothetical protein
MIRSFNIGSFLFGFLFLNYSAGAQSKDSIFRVDIWYSNGHYDFKQNGVSSFEEFISLRKESGSFLTSKYYTVKKLAAKDKSVHTDTSFSFSDKRVAKETIEKLVINLNQDKNNAREHQVKKLVETITDEQIIAVADEFKLNWMFENKYSDDTERKTLFRNIKSLKMFNAFYEHADPAYKILDTNYIFANKIIGIIITVYAAKDTVQYLGHTSSLILQPFCRVLDANTKKLRCLINIDINTMLSGILPSDSFFKKVLETELKKYYIKWSLDNDAMWE